MATLISAFVPKKLKQKSLVQNKILPHFTVLIWQFCNFYLWHCECLLLILNYRSYRFEIKSSQPYKRNNFYTTTSKFRLHFNKFDYNQLQCNPIIYFFEVIFAVFMVLFLRPVKLLYLFILCNLLSCNDYLFSCSDGQICCCQWQYCCCDWGESWQYMKLMWGRRSKEVTMALVSLPRP